MLGVAVLAVITALTPTVSGLTLGIDEKILAELERIDSKLDSLICHTGMNDVEFVNRGIAGATSYYTNDYRPMKAFLRETGFWICKSTNTLPQSLWFQFDQPTRVVKYSFTSRGVDEHHATVADGPSKYLFWASNDEDCSNESQWTILYTDTTGTPFTPTNEPKIENIINSNKYKCYGFKVLDVPGRPWSGTYGGKWSAIANVHFYTCD